jgi:hypothetical protein
MCEMYTQVERLMSLFSLDWALLGQSIGTDLTFMFTDGMDEFAELALQMTCIGDLVDAGVDAASEAIADGVEEGMSAEENCNDWEDGVCYDEEEFEEAEVEDAPQETEF